MIIPKVTRDIINQVASENEISFEAARQCVYEQFRFVANMLKESNLREPDTFNSVRLPYLGTFHSHERKIQIINDKLKSRENEHDE